MYIFKSLYLTNTLQNIYRYWNFIVEKNSKKRVVLVQDQGLEGKEVRQEELQSVGKILPHSKVKNIFRTLSADIVNEPQLVTVGALHTRTVSSG